MIIDFYIEKLLIPKGPTSIYGFISACSAARLGSCNIKLDTQTIVKGNGSYSKPHLEKKRSKLVSLQETKNDFGTFAGLCLCVQIYEHLEQHRKQKQ